MNEGTVGACWDTPRNEKSRTHDPRDNPSHKYHLRRFLATRILATLGCSSGAKRRFRTDTSLEHRINRQIAHNFLKSKTVNVASKCFILSFAFKSDRPPPTHWTLPCVPRYYCSESTRFVVYKFIVQIATRVIFFAIQTTVTHILRMTR